MPLGIVMFFAIMFFWGYILCYEDQARYRMSLKKGRIRQNPEIYRTRFTLKTNYEKLRLKNRDRRKEQIKKWMV